MPDEEMPEVSLNDEEQSPETHSTRLEQIKKRLLAFRPEKIFPVSLRNKLRGLDRVISSALIVLFASGIGYGAIIVDHHPSQPKQHFSAPVTPFLIQNTSPTQGESDLQTVNKIVIDFNKAIDPVKLNGDFWIFPVVKGTFTQTQSNEAIFTPDTPLLEGTAYNIMIHGEFKSLSGSALGADYHFNFTTATPSQSVIFSANNVRQTVGSVQVGKDENYSFSVGSSVDPSGEINVYKADQSALIDSLQSDANQLGGNSTDGVFVNPLIDTSNMTLVQSQKGLADGGTLKVNLPIGVYAIVASASGAQVGNTWLVVTDLGVALRQDDQQVVVAVSSLTTSQPLTADVKLYNFNQAQPVIAQGTIDNAGSIVVPYSLGDGAQWAVATNGDDFAISALNARWSLADLRVNADLSMSAQSFGLTDKPTYTVGEVVNYSGFLRSDNDVHYQSLINEKINVYLQNNDNPELGRNATVTSDSNGEISGNFTINRSLLDPSQDSGSFTLVITGHSSPWTFSNYSQLATFTVVRKAQVSNDIKVRFGKTDYLATDPITANITVRTSKGAKLSNSQVSVNIFQQSYDENSDSVPQVTSDNPGEPVNSESLIVKLDANGQATVPIDVSQLPAGSSHVLSLQASTASDSVNSAAEGSATTIIHQGNGKLEFGPTRGVVSPNGTLVARVYAKTLTNSEIPNATIQYSLTSSGDGTLSNISDVQIASGSVTADSTGYAQINQDIGNIDPATYPNLTLNVWTADSLNNKVEASATYYVQGAGGVIGHSDLQLSALDVSGSPTSVSVGQTLNLVVNSPEDIHALVAIDRGRIYKYETVDFKQGDNNYSVVVIPDMMPSFNLSFSYFSNGQFKVEGESFTVSPSSKQTSLQIVPDLTSYAAGSVANIQIKANDTSGNPLISNLVVGVVNEKMYRLNNQPIGDIMSFYQPRETTISSSSSLTGRGSGISGCGGGPNGLNGSSSVFNPTGTSLLWNPLLSTAADGTASFQVDLPKGTWRVFVYSIDQATDVGSSYIDVTAK